ncbi:short chain dehydrogenase [Tersicoccus solisilvae]|uniref:Short chain dehydrogenase n=1 Tax=Tersicoccus solisilvae TaxID=1882339 RepID=A0ABQ1NXN7_9MICC|nr:SDR family oxidoreductase [Tersicoccus solisilvae]GGC86862.1 short chain dehydrogenase [Tersicoccus solisilvae]
MDDRPHVLITGGTRGIGRAVAEQLAATHHLMIGGRDRDRTAEAAAAYPSAEPFVADLTSEQDVAAAAGRIDRLDALVHSAGITSLGTVEELTRQTWREVLEVNVVAVADLTSRLLPALRRARGQVVLINSGSGFFTNPGNSVYSASKFALRAFADTLREEERRHGIRVTSLHPGKVDTDMQRQIVEHQGEAYRTDAYLTPQSVARAVVFALTATPEAQVESLSVRPMTR